MLDSFLRSALDLIEPVGLVWSGLLLLAVVLWRRRQWFPFTVAALLSLFVTIIGGSDFSAWLLRRLEQPWTEFKIEDTPTCDAVVVLGGGAEPSVHETGGVRLTKAGDRITTGLELMRLGRASAMVVGGGLVKMDGFVKVESDLINARLALWNPPPGWEFISLGAATDTHDEALRLLPIARQRGWKRILLVTSASHMRRALTTYRAAGFDAVPAPCNFIVAGSAVRLGFGMHVPGNGGFERMEIWMHEVVGWEMYRRRGWLDVPVRGAVGK
jgi:uncharacterized SAM-binding protein YcdF (DUF218 family)